MKKQKLVMKMNLKFQKFLFCYWIDKSKNIINKENFERKFNEIEKALKYGNQLDIRKNYSQMFTAIAKSLRDETIGNEKRIKTANNFYNELNRFRITISSFSSRVYVTMYN